MNNTLRAEKSLEDLKKREIQRQMMRPRFISVVRMNDSSALIEPVSQSMAIDEGMSRIILERNALSETHSHGLDSDKDGYEFSSENAESLGQFEE